MEAGAQNAGGLEPPFGTPRQTFAKGNRVRRHSEYQGIQRTGRRVSTPAITVVWSSGAASPVRQARLGLVVSRKVGIAVMRNQFKRWTREWFRKNQARLPLGLDMVVIAKPGVLSRGHASLCAELDSLVRRLSAAPPRGVA